MRFATILWSIFDGASDFVVSASRHAIALNSVDRETQAPTIG
jgi:hypothetical protein